MALRLPDAPDLGRLPSAESNRPTASIDTTPIGAGLSAFGKGLESAGSNIANVAIREKAERNTLDDARARSRWLTGKVELDEQRDNITDPAELDRHGQKYTKLRDEAAGLYGDPARAERFRLETQPQLATSAKGVNDRKYELQSDQLRATTLGELDRLRDAGIRAKTEGERVAAIDTAKEYFQKLEDEGVLSAAERQVQQRAWIQNFARGRLGMQSPEARMEALRGDVTPTQNARTAYDFFIERGWKPHQAAGIVGNLMQESGLRTHARNAGDGSDGSDSIGIAQWNSDRAARLKRFAEARGTDWRDLKTQLEFVDLELRTSEGAAGRALTEARDVREATAAIVQYERPRGSDRGAESADGWANRLRHAQTYHGTWGGGALPGRAANSDVANVLPADERQSMFEQAQREDAANRAKQDYEARQEAATVTNLMADDIASIRATGKPVATLTEDRLAGSLGREAAAQHMRERKAEQTYYDTVSGFGSMTNDQIGQSVERVKPKGGTEGFTEQAAAHDRVAKEAARVMKMRDEDPASAVDTQPNIKPLADAVRANPNDIQGWRDLARERKTAQRALGIPETTVSPITRAEGRMLFDKVLEAGPGQEVAALRDTAKRIDEIFGQEDAQRVFAVGLAAAGVDKATRDVASVMLRRLGLGQPVDPADAKALESGQVGAAESRAVGPIPDPGYDMSMGVTPPAAATSAAPARTTAIPDGAIKMLIGDPRLAAQFDAKYGAGSAKRILDTAGVQPTPAPAKGVSSLVR